MNDYYMLKGYKKEGLDLNSFKKEAETIDNNTIIKEVPTDMTTAFFCYKQVVDSNLIKSMCQAVFDGSVYPDEKGDFERTEKIAFQSAVNSYSPDRHLLLELKENFLLNFEGNCRNPQENFFIDDASIKTLANKLSIKQGLLKKDNYTKALFITSGLSDIENTKIVYRTNGSYNRIVSFVGDKYKRTPLSEVYDISKEAEKQFTFDKWSIANSGSTVSFKYKDYTIKINTTETCEFANNVSVYLNKHLEYKLIFKPLAEIQDPKEYFKSLKKSIDSIDSLLSLTKEYGAVETAISNALGTKVSQFAFNYIESKENYLEAALEIPDIIELSENQKKEYSNILFKAFGEKLCA